MRKIFIFVLLNLLFVYSVAASTLYEEYVAKESGYVVEINGTQHNFKNPVVTIEDNTYVPLRELSEKIGYTVDWDANEKKISLSNNKSYKFYERIDESKSGILSNGMNFQYTADENFSYQEQLKQWGVTPVISQYGVVSTAKMAAEIGKDIFLFDKETPAIVIVYYDKNEDVWSVSIAREGVSHSGLRTVIIKRSNGEVIGKYELR